MKKMEISLVTCSDVVAQPLCHRLMNFDTVSDFSGMYIV